MSARFMRMYNHLRATSQVSCSVVGLERLCLSMMWVLVDSSRLRACMSQDLSSSKIYVEALLRCFLVGYAVERTLCVSRFLLVPLPPFGVPLLVVFSLRPCVYQGCVEVTAPHPGPCRALREEFLLSSLMLLILGPAGPCMRRPRLAL